MRTIRGRGKKICGLGLSTDVNVANADHSRKQNSNSRALLSSDRH